MSAIIRISKWLRVISAAALTFLLFITVLDVALRAVWKPITGVYELVSLSGVFGVTLLGQGQQDISDRFAGRIPEYEDRFLGIKTVTLTTGVPLLDEGLANFDCEVLVEHSVGDHTVFIGNVLAVRINQDNSPLIYYDRGYWRIHA